MISQNEIRAEAARWGIQEQQVEKDYFLGWLLTGISQHPELKDEWIFKGGTCLRKCYYETSRFSEDLDFTVLPEGPYQPTDLVRIFQEISEWTLEKVGIKFVVREDSFPIRSNKRGNLTIQGKIGFVGPQTKPSVPKIKIDLTKDELIASRPVHRPILQSYSDWVNEFVVLSYSLEELAAEKIRALYERCRPRDLYDVIQLYANPNLVGMHSKVNELLRAKCDFVGIDMPTIENVKTEENKDALYKDWVGMLANQLPSPLTGADSFWEELDRVFEWLSGNSSLINLNSAQIGTAPTTLILLKSLNYTRSGFNNSLLRYSAVNRFKIVIDYHAEKGGDETRIVEPYSIRRTTDGNLLLYAVNQSGGLRSYRLDRIFGMRPTEIRFIPRYQIEIS